MVVDEKKDKPELNEEIISLIKAMAEMGYEVKGLKQRFEYPSKVITLELFQCLLSE
jgi:hypothetical protein